VNRNWLVYLPSGISSHQSEKSTEDFERPEGALNYFRLERIGKAVVEEKHMGSRGIVVLCRTLQAARERFGVDGEVPGCVYTRNGRRFFKDEDTEAVFLERLEGVLTKAKFWERFSTNFVFLDGEILPWSVKAADSAEESGLVEAARLVLSNTAAAIVGSSVSSLGAHWRNAVNAEQESLERYDLMFKKYRTEDSGLSAIRFAPFHLLAAEGQAFFHRSHLWHMETLCHLARFGNGFLIPTRYEVVTLDDRRTWSKTEHWWEELSADSSEGLVVKGLPFVPRGRRGLAQPALKCRTSDHLRLVYGPRYDSGESREVLLSRTSLLRRRNKHRRILRQFALSMEAVNRFVKRSPMEDVHQCLLGVLAQEVAPMERH
jgi:protein phosphatase